jgi:hypothetical protein
VSAQPVTPEDLARLQRYWLGVAGYALRTDGTLGERLAVAVPPVPANARQAAGVC